MKTIKSEVDSSWCVVVYPEKQYGSGNGYFFTKTKNKDTAYAPNEVPGDVVAELRPLAVEAWSK